MKKTKLILVFTALVTAVAVGQCKEKTETTETEQATAASIGDASEVYSLQAAEVKWEGSKLFGASSHYGTIAAKSAQLGYKDGEPMAGKIVIDMTTLSSTDLEGEKKAKLDGHLKSEDFFGTENHPEATFEITEVKTGTVKGHTHSIVGNLTIKNKTQSIEFPADITLTEDTVTAKANLSFDRSKFDVRYGSKTFLPDLAQDKIIDDQIKLQLNLTLKKS